MIVLTGESGSGKSTVEDLLSKQGLNHIISCTTRKPREGEQDGIDYKFMTKEEFLEGLNTGRFAEYVIYRENYYGILVEDCEANSIVVVEPNGFRQLKKIKNIDIVSFYIHVDSRERMIRMLKRGDVIEEVFKRYEYDKVAFAGIANEVNYIVENTSIEDVVDKIVKILKEKGKL